MLCLHITTSNYLVKLVKSVNLNFWYFTTFECAYRPEQLEGKGAAGEAGRMLEEVEEQRTPSWSLVG